MDGNSFVCCIQMVLAIEQLNSISLVVKCFNFPRSAIFVDLGVTYITFPQHLGNKTGKQYYQYIKSTEFLFTGAKPGQEQHQKLAGMKASVSKRNTSFGNEFYR